MLLHSFLRSFVSYVYFRYSTYVSFPVGTYPFQYICIHCNKYIMIKLSVWAFQINRSRLRWTSRTLSTGKITFICQKRPSLSSYCNHVRQIKHILSSWLNITVIDLFSAKISIPIAQILSLFQPERCKLYQYLLPDIIVHYACTTLFFQK